MSNESSNQKLYEEAFALLARADALLDGVRSRHEAHLANMLAEIDLRFTSANEVPVERAVVKAPEWATIRQYISAALSQRSAPEPTLTLDPGCIRQIADNLQEADEAELLEGLVCEAAITALRDIATEIERFGPKTTPDTDEGMKP
jgi:hypothetical protein